jgi:hypothetical protein
MLRIVIIIMPAGIMKIGKKPDKVSMCSGLCCQAETIPVYPFPVTDPMDPLPIKNILPFYYVK